MIEKLTTQELADQLCDQWEAQLHAIFSKYFTEPTDPNNE